MDFQNLTAFADSVLTAANVPGAQLCVRGADGVLYSECFGTKNGSDPIGPQTIFGIASMSKSITCAAAALLESEGKLSFDDPVTRYLPSFRIPGTPPEAVTVEHLAMHTTGLPPLPTLGWSMTHNTPDDPWGVEANGRWRADAQYKVDKLQDIIDYIATSGDFKPLGQPGEYMSYSNDGYALLSAVVDAAAGESLESYVESRIFAPLGMTRSTFSLDRVLADNDRTSLYSRVEGTPRASDLWDIAPPYRGCGWVKSTAEDMTRYYLMLSQNGMFEGKRILPASCVARMTGRAFPETPRGKYCYGLTKRLVGDAALCEHSGGLKGVSSRGGYICGGGLSVTLLTNIGDFDCTPITNAVYNLALGRSIDASHQVLTPTGAPCSTPEVYTGTFRSREDLDGKLTITADEKGELTAHAFGLTMPLVFCGQTDFLLAMPDKPLDRCPIVRGFVHDGSAWAVSYGSRMFQRV